MFDLDGLEQVDPVALEVNFNIDGDVLSMRCPREGVTPHDVQKSFEQRGVLYANRIRFVLTDDGTRTLNPRSDTLPLTPAVIKLVGKLHTRSGPTQGVLTRSGGAGRSLKVRGRRVRTPGTCVPPLQQEGLDEAVALIAGRSSFALGLRPHAKQLCRDVMQCPAGVVAVRFLVSGGGVI
ncbi:unnamed protein product [Effrenium voratum]|nr:unnamed protein product [Effrenium voratum]